MVELYKESGLELPQNTTIGKSTDLLIRKLDCAVVQTALTYNKKANAHPYDSVKGVFWIRDCVQNGRDLKDVEKNYGIRFSKPL